MLSLPLSLSYSFETSSFTKPESLHLGWLAQELPGSVCLSSTVLRIQAHTAAPQSLCECSGLKLRSRAFGESCFTTEPFP